MNAAVLFGEVAPRIAGNGWRPVPLKARTKVPAVSDWPNFALAPGDELTYIGCSVGLLLGNGVIAVDVDVRDPVAAARIEALAVCMLGAGLKRVGAAPKLALLYRTEGELPYSATCRYRFPADAAGAKAHRIEVLTDGKQLAAFGVHPDTGRPYTWNGSGSPLDRRVDSLPLVTAEKIAEFLREAEAVLAEFGQRIETRQLGPDGGKHDTSELGQRARDPAQFRDALRFLPNDFDRESWIKLAHSIRAALGPEGWPDFEAWCKKSPSYTGCGTKRVWDSLNPTSASAGTLLREARLRGWRPKERAEPAGDPAAGVSPLGLLWFAGLDTYTPAKQTVQGLLLEGSLFVMYGESNAGKTFLTLDLALSVAAGLPWRERRTRKGLVVYVAGEGVASLRARVAAWRIEHPDMRVLPFAIVPQAVDFLDPEAVDRLIATIRAAEAECGERAALVILDTFARTIPGGDENSAQDVGLAVLGADRVRAQTGAVVGFVHHCGKDPSKGARGSSALRAATDTEILIEGAGGRRVATVTKQRDLETGDPMPFELVPVEIGTDPETGEPVTSCTVRHSRSDPATAGGASKEFRGRAQRQMLAALRARAESEPGKVWTLLDLRRVGRELGLSKGSARSAVDALVSSPYMRLEGVGYVFTDGKAAE